MKIEEAKRIQKAFNHFVEGGRLWYYSYPDREWYIQDTLWTEPTICIKASNIIEDKFFEVRKAHDLGMKIEMYVTDLTKWMLREDPCWDSSHKYRVKSKEEYEWVWYKEEGNGKIRFTGFHTTAMSPEYWKKFEPSKRIKK